MRAALKILLLEDDVKLANEIKHYFVSTGDECDIAYDGVMLLKMNRKNLYNIYILDINVPALNGLEVCKIIRKTDKVTPILMLTAFGEVSDKVEALRAGADDYIVKPFHFDELIARIKVLIRRAAIPQNYEEEIVSIKDLVINMTQMYVTRGGIEINLTPKEFKLLAFLANAKGRTLSKKIIAEQVWDLDFHTSINTVEVYISFLRNKIDKNFDEKLIQTKVGFGYYLKSS